MTTGYEVEMYHHIGQIARDLYRIANCLEAQEARARRQEAQEEAVTVIFDGAQDD